MELHDYGLSNCLVLHPFDIYWFCRPCCVKRADIYAAVKLRHSDRYGVPITMTTRHNSDNIV